jgi:hypothetical protein
MRLTGHLFSLAFAWFAFDFKSPLPRLRIERQMESGEDSVSEASSAAAHMRR